MRRLLTTCKPAARILGRDKGDVDCDMCPFPFCVVAEVGTMREEVREHLALTMKKFGSSMEEIAKAIGVTLRTAYRYTYPYENTKCEQCNMVHAKGVLCKSLTFTVANREQDYVTLLNRHGHATSSESSSIRMFMEYAFPDSGVNMLNGGHDSWLISGVSAEEAVRFSGMCNALEKYSECKVIETIPEGT
jgi:hypothetical protein